LRNKAEAQVWLAAAEMRAYLVSMGSPHWLQWLIRIAALLT